MRGSQVRPLTRRSARTRSARDPFVVCHNRPTAGHSMSSSLPERVGRYEVVERLGTGGMGVVYLATDPLLRRTVAVKVLPGENEDLRERFAREARSAAGLRHNNIVTIYDVGEDNDQPFIAMEFIDGESMAEMIRR